MSKHIIIEELKVFSPVSAERIRQLVTQLDSHYQALPNEDVERMLTSENTHLYVARLHETGDIVGMVTLITYRIPYKMKAWIEDIVVDDRYRGQGVGTQLINHATHEAKKYHVTSLNLTSNPKREAANNLYIRLGFEKRETNVYRKNL